MICQARLLRKVEQTRYPKTVLNDFSPAEHFQSRSCFSPNDILSPGIGYMRPVGDIIWCGVSAPVVQSIFVGLVVSAVGLIVFPVRLCTHPTPSRIPVKLQSGYSIP